MKTKTKTTLPPSGKKPLGSALYVDDGTGTDTLFLQGTYEVGEEHKRDAAALRFRSYGSKVTIVTISEGDHIPRVV